MIKYDRRRSPDPRVMEAAEMMQDAVLCCADEEESLVHSKVLLAFGMGLGWYLNFLVAEHNATPEFCQTSIDQITGFIKEALAGEAQAREERKVVNIARRGNQ